MVTLVGSPLTARGLFTCLAAFAGTLLISLFLSEHALAFSNQTVDVGGNATSDSDLTVIGTTTNKNTTTQRCTSRREALGMCSQDATSRNTATTNINAGMETTATNSATVDQKAPGDDFSNQDAGVTGNSTAGATGYVDGATTNNNTVDQRCTKRRAVLGLCTQTSNDGNAATTNINAGSTTRATLSRNIKQR